MGGKDLELARASACALGTAGRAAGDLVAPALIVALRHKDEAVHANALASLRSIERDPVPVLVAILNGRDRRLAFWPGLAQGRLGPVARGAIPDLVAILKNKDGQLVSAAVEALGGIGRDASVTVPDLMVLSRGADNRLGESIRRAIDRIKADQHLRP